MPVVFFTSKNIASKNIAEEFFSYCPKGIEVIDTKVDSVLDLPVIPEDADYAVVLSSHRSNTAGKMITAHFPGNWNRADFGGEPRCLNIAYGSKVKEFIKSALPLAARINWPVCMEADHHGPTPIRPIIFVEIGSGENEWTNKDAARVVAQATAENEWTNKDAARVVAQATADMLKSRKTYTSAFAVGGGHYAYEFTRFLVESEIAIGHILPKYAIDDLDNEMFEQAIKRNVEDVNSVLVLKDQTNRRQKEKIRHLCEIYKKEYIEV